MSYSTPAMVRKALVPGSDGVVPSPVSHTAADLSDAELQDSIDEADATIDAYITAQYATPVAPVNAAIPHPIDFWSRNIAAYVATLGYRGSLDFTDTDPVARRYKATMDALNAVAANKMNLVIPQNEGSGSATAAAPPINPYVGDLWTPEDFSISPAMSPQLNQTGRWSPYWSEPL
jgi:phage gp36-like protein